MTDDTLPDPALPPSVLRACQSHFDSDLVDWNVPGFLTTQASFVATAIAGGDDDLETIRAAVERLRSQEQAALRALDHACGWSWGEEASTRAALKMIVAEISKALEFRMRWNARGG